MIINQQSVESQYINLYDLSKKDLFFPIFQRGFSWKPIQTEKILEDLVNNISQLNKQIYLLDFIWFEEDGKFKVADGQQRIMTIFILIKCINDFIDSELVTLPKLDNFRISYDEEINQEKFIKFNNNIFVSPYKKVYLHLREFVRNNKHQLNKIVSIIKSNIYIFLKKAENVDDAFEIFKQINTGGKPLSKDEIIKTIITQYSSKYSIPITSSLKDVRKLIISYHKYINDEKQSNFDSIGIMSFLNRSIVNNISSFRVFSNYLDTVSSINKQAIYHISSYINRSQIIDIIYILGIKGVKIDKNREYLDKILMPLCLLSIILTIKKVNPGGIILTLYSNIIEMIKGNETIEKIEKFILTFIDDNKQICKISMLDFSEGLGSIELSQNIKKAILIMDIVRSNTSGSLDVESINVEHIYPQSPVLSWATNGWPVNREEQKKIINNIGNMFLLNQKINKKIQNKYIDEKLVEYKKIIKKDIFIQTPMNTIDFPLFKNNKELYIEKRQQQIAESVQNDFHFGKVLIY